MQRLAINAMHLEGQKAQSDKCTEDEAMRTGGRHPRADTDVPYAVTCSRI